MSLRIDYGPDGPDKDFPETCKPVGSSAGSFAVAAAAVPWEKLMPVHEGKLPKAVGDDWACIEYNAAVGRYNDAVARVAPILDAFKQLHGRAQVEERAFKEAVDVAVQHGQRNEYQLLSKAEQVLSKQRYRGGSGKDGPFLKELQDAMTALKTVDAHNAEYERLIKVAKTLPHKLYAELFPYKKTLRDIHQTLKYMLYYLGTVEERRRRMQNDQDTITHVLDCYNRETDLMQKKLQEPETESADEAETGAETETETGTGRFTEDQD